MRIQSGGIRFTNETTRNLRLKILKPNYEDQTIMGIEKCFNDWIESREDDIEICGIETAQPYKNHVTMFFIWYKPKYAYEFQDNGYEIRREGSI